jgi:uncharacterized protein (TIGR02145 family)
MGTAYGSQVSFETEGGNCPATVTDIEGNIYSTVLMGDQCWMAENLKTTTYSNNTPIPYVPDLDTWHGLTTGAYVWYDNNISWKDIYGALYNWYTTMDANGLCPTGWHVPSYEDWISMTDFIGGMESPHGNELKSCRQVSSPLGGDCNTSEHPRWSQNNSHYGTDDYGFSGLPGGARHFFGIGTDMGATSYWWSSSQNSSNEPWSSYLSYSSGAMNVVHGNLKYYGFSVRCLKD